MSDYTDLKKASNHSIELTAREGEPKYGKDAWRTREDIEDIAHAICHIGNSFSAVPGDYTDIMHAHFRLTAILARR